MTEKTEHKSPNSWESILVEDAVQNISLNGIKVRQKEYLDKGEFIVIDQGQELVGGYSNDLQKVVKCSLPVIIFGDHTRVIKYVNKPFIAGADGIKVLQPHAFFVPKLLEYFLQRLALTITNKGYARHYQHLAKASIFVPPINEQKRIVAKIEELFTELEAGVASLQLAQAQLKTYRQALLKHAFEGKLTAQWRADNPDKLEDAQTLLQRIKAERQTRYEAELAAWEKGGKENGRKPRPPQDLPPLTPAELNELPELPAGWAWGKLGWMTCGVEYGTSAKSSENGTHPVLRMGNIQNAKFDWSDLVYTSEPDEIEKYLLREDDVLFNRTNSPEWVGKTAIYKATRPAIFAGYLIRVNQIKSVINSQYLNLFLNSPVAKNQGNRVKTDGVNQSNINGEKLSNYPFPFCLLAEQNEIINQLEMKLSVVDDFEQEISDNLVRAEALRQSILKKAFAGQLVPQDPQDEPASVLLSRIRAAKNDNR